MKSMKKLIAFVTTLCLLLTTFGVLPLTVSADSGWTDGWGISGDANAISIKNDVIKCDIPSGAGENFVQKPNFVGRNFDIEWTMSVQQFPTSGCYFLLYTGSERFYIQIHNSMIQWEDIRESDGATIQENIAVDIGNEAHTYRMVAQNGAADLYMDDYYICTIDKAPSSGGTPLWRWYMAGNTGRNAYTITDVTINKFNGRESFGGDESAEEETVETTLYEDMSTVGWTNKLLPAVDTRFEFEDRNSVKDWVVRDCWSFEDGIAYHDSTDSTAMNYNLQILSMYGAFGLEKGQDFILTKKVKFNQFDEKWLFNVTWPGYACRSFIFPDVIEIENERGYSPYASDPINLVTSGNKGDGKWHEIAVKTSHGGTKMQMFLDGEAVTGILDAYKNNNYERNGMVYIAGMANASYGWDVEVDWVDIKIIDNDLKIDTPMLKAEYLEGEPIALRASLLENVEGEIPSVDYKMNGEVVATGQAPDYRATIEGLGAGTYEITAEYEDHVSGAVEFSVREGIKGYLAPVVDENGTLTASMKFYEKNPKLNKVEYFLDGNLVTTTKTAPYTMKAANLSPMGHTLEAICYDANNIVLGEFSEEIIPAIQGNQVSQNYANDITYSVSGSGSAVVEYSNGTHLLKLTHTDTQVTCLTDTGEETYDFGIGNFRIMTDGPVVEGYHNGQFVFSYYMPQTKEVGKKITENGLKINDFKVVIPEERSNYFVGKNITGKNMFRLGETGPYHVVDFVASGDDQVHIALNDGFYRMDFTMKDGKFYTWTSKEVSSEPFVEEQLGASAPAEETYYRIETATGMTRLFANGRWIATWRDIQAAGDNTLVVDVQGGDGLSHLAVSDLSDIYYYEDDFSGKGKFDSDSYFRMHQGMGIEADYEFNRLNLSARGANAKDAMAEINVNLGDFDLSADVRVKKNTKGFYIYYNRPTTPDYSKVGYNYVTKQWEIVNTIGRNTTVVTAPGVLPQEEDVRLDLKVRIDEEGKNVVLYMNGQKVISQDGGPYERGRIGFAITDGSASIKSFYLRGDSKPMPGVNHYVHGPSYFDGVEQDGVYRFFGRSLGAYETKDNGMTMEYFTITGSNPSDQICLLPNGEILSVVTAATGTKIDGKNIYNATAVVSKDNGRSFEVVGTLIDNPTGMVASSGGRLKVGASGRVYFMAALDATENPWNHAGLFFSDDNGRTWTQGGTILAEDIDATIVEHIVVEAEGDELHCYTRTDQGTIIKIISYDRGMTWDTDHVYKTPFLSPECCMNLEADPEHPNIFWATWSYDNDNLSGQGQYPRTNQSVAVSYDYGKNWHFYGKPFENNAITAASATTNMNFDIGKDWVVINSPSYDSVLGNGDKPRYVFIPKDQQVVSMRWEKVYNERPGQETFTMPLSYSDMDRCLAIHADSGSVLLRGVRATDVVVDGKVSAEVLASYLGGTAIDGENGALVFQYAGSENTVSADAIAVVDGKKYVDPKAFAEATDLYIEDEKGTLVISPFEFLGISQREALRYGLDFFTDQV